MGTPLAFWPGFPEDEFAPGFLEQAVIARSMAAAVKTGSGETGAIFIGLMELRINPTRALGVIFMRNWLVELCAFGFVEQGG